MERPNKEEKLHQNSTKRTKKSNPKTINKCRSLSDLRTTVQGIHLHNNPPQNPLFSLQPKKTPSEIGLGKWKIRNNELAIEELIRSDTKEAFETGNLTGRRLSEDTNFWDSDGSICSRSSADHENDNMKNIESRSVCSSHSSVSSGLGSYVCDECMEREIAVEEGEKEVNVGGIKGISLKEYKGWFGFCVCVVGVITVWRVCSNDDEVMFLVPT